MSAVEDAEPSLRLDAGGMCVALVIELARLAVAVRPDGRAVERGHATTLQVALSH
jgi:hypothetical protein